MKKRKIWLISACCLCILGVALFSYAMASLNFDFTKLSTEKYETNTYEIDGEFLNISIDEDISDIEIKLSNDGKCKVVCFEEAKAKHNAYIKDSTLIIDIDDNREWYDYIGISLGSTKVTLYLPQKEYQLLNINIDTGDVKIYDGFNFEKIKIKADTSDITCNSTIAKTIDIKTSTGEVVLDGGAASNITVKTSTGEIIFDKVKCMTLDIKTSTGDVHLNETMSIKELFTTTSTGNVHFNNSDAGKIKVKTSTGNVKGNLLRDKIFITETSTGDIDVPQSTTGDICEIITSTGDIDISLGFIE